MVFTRAVVGEGAPSSVLRTAPPRAQSDFRSRSRLARSRVATRRAMSCRLGEATALSSCARRANTQHVGAQSLVHDIHGGCARVSMVSFGRDPAPELVGVPRVGSLKVGLKLWFYLPRVCGCLVGLPPHRSGNSRPLNFTQLRIWRGLLAAVGTRQRLH